MSTSQHYYKDNYTLPQQLKAKKLILNFQVILNQVWNTKYKFITINYITDVIKIH